jgi:hypothetical protein
MNRAAHQIVRAGIRFLALVERFTAKFDSGTPWVEWHKAGLPWPTDEEEEWDRGDDGDGIHDWASEMLDDATGFIWALTRFLDGFGANALGRRRTP